MNKANNARSRRTVKRMEDVYLQLLAEHPECTVSVKQLCLNAKVNRTTFYSHFEDILDLQMRIEKRISSEVSTIFQDRGYGEHTMTRERFTVLLEYIRQNRLFYKAWYLSGRMDDPSAIAALLSRPYLTGEDRFRIIFHKAGTTAVFRDWVVRGCLESNDQMLSLLADLFNW